MGLRWRINAYFVQAAFKMLYRIMLKVIYILLLLTCTLSSYGQDKSNRGREFWLAYGNNYKFQYEAPLNDQDLAIYISTEAAATVTVSINGTGFSQTLNIPANTVDASVIVPKSGPNDARILTDGFSNKGIHILSDVPVAVYAHMYGPLVSGATMLMPVETYGYSYYSVNYYQTTSQSSPNGWFSWAHVIASEDNTRIEITPSDTTKEGWLPGTVNVVNLNKGEVYNIFGKAIFDGNAANASKDMTGSKFVSIVGSDGRCHPMAVFSGSSGIRLCRGDGGEYMHQQVFPSQAWGTRYLTYHTVNNTTTNITETNRNYYRVCVSDPTAVVRRNGIVLTGLIKNFFYEYLDSTGGDYITSDKPILVSQYTPNKNQCWNFPTTSPAPPSYGDPEMFYLSPIEQGQKSVLFYVSRKSTIDYVYANIHLPTNAVPSLRVDGAVVPAAQIIPHPNFPSYSVALVRFIGPAAQHRIIADSAFNATVYGLGNYESYGYNVGTLINNLNNYTAIANVNNANGQIDTFTCPNTPFRFSVQLAFPATSINWKISQVAGIVPQTGDVIDNAPVPTQTLLINGRTYYEYTLAAPYSFLTTGTYYLPYSYTSAGIGNCAQTDTGNIKVVVKPGPVADFSFANACLGDATQLTGLGNANGFNLIQYLWNFDDNTTAAVQSPQKVFTSSGNHDTRYRIYADNGCVGDTTKPVVVAARPVSSFALTQNPVCNDGLINIEQITPSPVVPITSWEWHYGDAVIETKTNSNPFTHTYATTGNYPLYLVVSSSAACTDTSQIVNVVVEPKPKAYLKTNTTVCLGQSINIVDSSYSFTSNNITDWHLFYGDGLSNAYANSIPSSIPHTYSSAGSYVIKLVVNTNSYAGCNSDTFSITVNVIDKPNAAFTITGKSCVDSLQQFTSATNPIAGVATTWFWDFGDGSVFNSTSSAQATHRYTNTLTNVTVRHWVQQGNCLSDTVTRSIPLIDTNPSAAFTLQPTSICVAEDVVFTSSSSSSNTFIWDFGNGIGNQVPTFTRRYSSSGDVTIKLQTISPQGCASAIVTQELIVSPVPIVNAGVDILKKQNDTARLQGTVLNGLGNTQLTWTPGSFLTSTTILRPITSTPNDIQYILTATDPIFGCSSSDSVNIKIVTDLFIPNAFAPGGNNKLWRIPSLVLFPKAQVVVFNRYGQKIYTSNGPNVSWNGRFQGLDQPQGAYIYIINFNDPTQKDLKGTVMLVR